MFVTRKTLDRELKREIELKDKQLRNIWNWYWELSHKHDHLLKHLGLEEIKIPESTEIRKIKDSDVNSSTLSIHENLKKMGDIIQKMGASK